jgi:hypothetical protein
MLPLAVALLLVLGTSVLAQTSNLPSVAPGVFNVSTRIEIQATTSAVWDTLTNFPAYAEWNPFVRSVDEDCPQSRLRSNMPAPGRLL